MVIVAVVTVALAFGRGIDPRGDSNPANDSTAALAAKLFLTGKADHILMSGGYSWLMDEPPADRREADNMAEVARSQGVPETAIVLERESTDSVTNLLESKQILLDNNWRDVIGCVIPYNSLRRAYSARKVYGREINFRTMVSSYHHPGGWREHLRVIMIESAMTIITAWVLRGIKPGDHEAVRRRWVAWMAKYRSLGQKI